MGADCTQEGNPWTLTAQLKHTGVIAAMVIDHFCAGTLEGGLTVLDLFSGGVGTAHVGSVGNWLNKDVLIEKLGEMYNAPIASLMDEPEDSEGNVDWAASW